jgi:hypothetical protein
VQGRDQLKKMLTDNPETFAVLETEVRTKLGMTAPQPLNGDALNGVEASEVAPRSKAAKQS